MDLIREIARRSCAPREVPALVPGRYVATGRVPLLPPFEAAWIEPGETFEIRDCSTDMVLVGFQNQLVWKQDGHFAGKVRKVEALRLWLVSTPAHIDEERVPLDDIGMLAREMGIAVALAA